MVVDCLFIVTPIVGVCNCSMFCCTLLYVHSSIAIILMGKRELVDLLDLSYWCLVMVVRLLLAVPWGFSAVWDCGISRSYALTIFIAYHDIYNCAQFFNYFKRLSVCV